MPALSPPLFRPRSLVPPIALKSLGTALLGLGLHLALTQPVLAAGTLDLLREARPLELLPQVPGNSPTAEAFSRRTQASQASQDPDRPLPAASVPPGPRVEVKGFRISGARQVPEPELQARLADALGQRLDFGQLQALIQRLRGVYARYGLSAVEVILPRQKAQDGLIEIAISEGRIGRSALITTRPSDEPELRAWTPAMQAGQPLDLNAIERDLIALSTIEGLSSEVRLAPGEQPGSSDLSLEAQRTRSWRGEISLDNSNALIGAPTQLRARADWINPTRLGSRLQVGLDAGESGLGRLGLTGSLQQADGTAMSAELAWLGFSIDQPLSGEMVLNEPNHQTGHGTLLALQLLSTPVLEASRRTQSRVRLEWMRGFDELRSGYQVGYYASYPDVYVTGIEHSLESTRQTQGSVSFGLLDQARTDQGLRSSIDLSVTLGYFEGRGVPWADRPDLYQAGQPLPPSTAQKDSTGIYSRVLGRGALSQPFAPGWGFNARADLQWSSAALPRHEQLVLTGPMGVRAYALDDQRADQGLRASVEARRSTGRVEGFVFADLGWGMASATPEQRLTFAPTEWFNLAGAGLGFELRLTPGARLNAQFAWKIDTATAEMRTPQFWFTLKQSF
jgi:hemolysin activation/secretion protein